MSAVVGQSFKTGLIRLNNFNCARYIQYAQDSSCSRIGFIGSGNMGSKMSANLIQKGHEVLVYDNDPSTIARLKKEKFRLASNINEVVEFGNCFISMLPDGNAVLNLYRGIADKLKTGSLIIDCSTIDPRDSIELKQVLNRPNISYVDAPVSGGVNSAAKGTLTFMVGGDKTAFEKAKTILLSMGTNVIHCGKIGNGQVAKICNNMLLGISMIGLSESLNLGNKMGLDQKLLLQIINSSSGRCWSSEVYSPVPQTMDNVPSSNEYRPGFQSQIMLKDLRIAKDSSDRNGVATPLGQNAYSVYEQMCETPMANLDFSIVYKYLESLNAKN